MRSRPRAARFRPLSAEVPVPMDPPEEFPDAHHHGGREEQRFEAITTQSPPGPPHLRYAVSASTWHLVVEER